MAQLDDLIELFKGYDRAHGRFDVKRTSERGKAEGKAFTVTTHGATEIEWREHLTGEGPGLGIIPLLEDDTVAWAVIDIDTYPLDHSELEKRVKKRKLPLVICRSKSGGAHLFLFLQEPAPADVVTAAMASWAALLGHGGCEVFPKQTGRATPADVGNWLNMPYYNVSDTARYGIRDGEALSLGAFLQHAYTKRVTLDKLAKLEDGDEEDTGGLYEGGPPCLQHIYNAGGFPDGTRNDGMFSVGVYLRKRFPDDWDTRLSQYSAAMCTPGLPVTELSNIVKSLSRKEYEYRCKQAPIKDHCNRRECIKRTFGVGDVAGTNIEIGNITKHEGDPVIWFVEVSGKRLQMSTPDLQFQQRFHRICIEQLSIFPDEIPKRRWGRYIHEKLQDADVIVPAEDGVTRPGQFSALLDQYLTGVGQLTHRDELKTRSAPYRPGDGTVWFKLQGLTDYLDTHRFRSAGANEVVTMLKDLGASKKFLNTKKGGVNIWILPDTMEDEDATPIPDFGTKEF